MTTETTRSVAHTALSKVPEVTAYFWIIPIFATTNASCAHKSAGGDTDHVLPGDPVRTFREAPRWSPTRVAGTMRPRA